MTALDIRRWHTYIGVLIAPSVIFFALTGALQLFRLHEAHGDYHPLPLVEKLGALHTDQVFGVAQDHDAAAPRLTMPDEPPAPLAKRPGDRDKPERPMSLALKWFFLLVAVGLAASSSLGIYLGVTQTHRKVLAWTLLAAGCLLPLFLLTLA